MEAEQLSGQPVKWLIWQMLLSQMHLIGCCLILLRHLAPGHEPSFLSAALSLNPWPLAVASELNYTEPWWHTVCTCHHSLTHSYTVCNSSKVVIHIQWQHTKQLSDWLEEYTVTVWCQGCLPVWLLGWFFFIYCGSAQRKHKQVDMVKNVILAPSAHVCTSHAYQSVIDGIFIISPW